jgi:pyruvate/2-oxoacid:ferredoxin oxidoreductase beta subunit
MSQDEQQQWARDQFKTMVAKHKATEEGIWMSTRFKQMVVKQNEFEATKKEEAATSTKTAPSAEQQSASVSAAEILRKRTRSGEEPHANEGGK